MLHPARVAPPSVARDPATQDLEQIKATITLLLPEEQDWNQWPGQGVRLFNNRGIYLFHIQIQGSATLQWNPQNTRLTVNSVEHVLFPLRIADDVLVLLRHAAVQEQEWVLDFDFTERLRNASAFRAKYMPLESQSDTLSGLIAFPAEIYDQHVVAMKLEIGVATTREELNFSWILE